VSSTGTCHCVMVMVGDSGMQKVCGKISCVTRTCVRSSVMRRSVVMRKPQGVASLDNSGRWNSRMMRDMGQASPSTSPRLALRN